MFQLLNSAEQIIGILSFVYCPASDEEEQGAGKGQNQDSWSKMAKDFP